jgi:hypothetical protein
MKVKDLIERLQAVDPELMVVRPGYEGGVTEVEITNVELTVALNVHEEWYYGEHEIVDADEGDNVYPAGTKYTAVFYIV